VNERPIERLSRHLLERQWITGSLAVLLLVASLLLAWQWEQRENAAQIREDTGQARVLAGSLAGALAFDDTDTAREYVAALRVDQSIRAAAVYDTSGRMVAGFARGGEKVPDRVVPQPPKISGGRLTVVEPVTEGELNLGQVYLLTSIEPISARLSRYFAIGIVLLLAALLIALLGASNAAAAAANRELQAQIAAREQAERALRQAQKMEALGQLTGGVAHDFNNLLMAASSGLELLDRAKTEERRASLKVAIREALDRGARITEQLLAFSRRRPVRSEVIQLQEHMSKLVNLLDHSLRENVSARFQIAEDLWSVEVDVSQFDIAILNLAVNAKDAMPRGGELCVTAANRPGALGGRDAVEIGVEDEGEGMSPDALDKAFEPFFTTKDVGKGTGLGLSQVYGFVRAAGGTVAIDSEPGKGTRVTLLLPRAEPLPALAAKPARAASAKIGRKRVLLVEDDAQLNELVTQMLEELGAEVLRASSAAEGLRQFDPAAVDAVISDMVMPGAMNGLELARAVRARKPDAAVLLMTGYSDAAGAAEAEGYPVLRKPFTLAQLEERFPLAALRQTAPPGPS
jgi:signal transduction histidine kinase/CheY-like chemotaxis protein